MDQITIGQLVACIGSLTVLGGFFIAIYKFVKTVVLDKIEKNEKDIDLINGEIRKIKVEITDSKEERLVLLKGQLAGLKGLKEQGCDGPVTQAINDIENYIIKKSHD